MHYAPTAAAAAAALTMRFSRKTRKRFSSKTMKSACERGKLFIKHARLKSWPASYVQCCYKPKFSLGGLIAVTIHARSFVTICFD